MKKLFSNLTFWVLTAILTGALLGYFAPKTAISMQFLGTKFISLVTLFIYPIIFLTISIGISSMGDLKKVGRVGGKALLYFEIVTTAALLIGVLVMKIFHPGNGVSIINDAANSVNAYTQKARNFSWVKFLQDNITLQILLLAIISGIFLSLYKKKDKILSVLNFVSKYIFLALKFVMYLAPIGAFGGMAFTIGKYGLHTLLPLGKLLICVYVTMALFIFIILNLVLRFYRISIFQFLKFIKAEILIVFGTSSSEAALPSLMNKLELFGCSKSVVGLVVPAGYSFNLDGTTMYLSMATLFLAQVYNIQLSFIQDLTIIGILFITSKGAAGVTGSGFVVLASTLTAIKVIPIEGLAILLGVDRFMSEARAITNFIGNGVATLFIANNEKEFDRKKMEALIAIK